MRKADSSDQRIPRETNESGQLTPAAPGSLRCYFRHHLVGDVEVGVDLLDVVVLFERKGIILVPKDATDEDELMMAALESGAEDVEEQESDYRVVTSPEEFTAVRGALDEAGIPYENAEITMEPQNSIDLDAGTAKQTLRLIDALEENDDVQEVYANFDISDEVMAEVAS